MSSDTPTPSRRFIVATLAALLVGAALLGRAAVPYLGASAGAVLASASAYLRPDASAEPLIIGEEGIGEELCFPLSPPLDALVDHRDADKPSSPSEQDGPTARATTAKRGATGRLKPRGGIKLSAGLIRGAAEAGIRPSGTPVAPMGMRPAGLALHGVSGHGAGLVDGDVLTELAGASAVDEGAIIGAVSAAVRAEAPVITGTIWRQGRPMSLVVEIPKMQKRKKRKKPSLASRDDEANDAGQTPAAGAPPG